MKREIRVLGVDDGHFEKSGPAREVLVIGAVLRGSSELEGVLSTTVEKDGFDATDRLVGLVQKTKHRDQLRAIMLNGTTLAGFNLVDIADLSRRTRLPVIAVLRRKPDDEAVRKALAHLPMAAERLEIPKKAGRLYPYKRMFLQFAGLTFREAQAVVDATLAKANIPEPVRLAHLIASGITTGESTRRA